MNAPRSVPRLHEHRDLFTERNLFLHALLGTLSFGTQFASYVERVADTASEPPSTGSSRSVYAVLGVLSLWRRIEAELVSWGGPRTELDASGASSPEPSTRGVASAEELRTPRMILR